MISQNRADEKREMIANQQWGHGAGGEVQNKELLDLSHQILDLTKAVHAATGAKILGAERDRASERGRRSHSPAGDREAGSGPSATLARSFLSMARATAHDEHRAHGAVGDALADAAQRGHPVQPAAADDHEVRALGGGD